MLPYCGLLLVFWILTYYWLIQIGSTQRTLAKILSIVGVLSVLFLILHLVNLGEPGDLSHRLRRIGVNGNLLLTFFAQILLVSALYPLRFQDRRISGTWAKIILCLLMLALGLVSIPVGELEHNKRAWQNIIEWNFFALVFIYFWFSFSWLGQHWFRLEDLKKHGVRARGDDMIPQITAFLDPFCSDPNLLYFAGPNICQDVQFAVFAPTESGKDVVRSFATAHRFTRAKRSSSGMETR